jgi:ferric-dicitrate binding protein FerR (iron transport regulator)
MARKGSNNALLALAAAGGLWAWQNRDKVSGWINQLNTQLGQQQSHRKTLSDTSHAPAVQSYTGNTQRIGDEANEI